MKVVVLGGEGMLGHKMFQTLHARYPQTICTIFGSRSDEFYRKIDIFSPDAVIDRVNAMDMECLQSVLAGIKPDYIINCIGIVKQRTEASFAIPSIALNSLLPHKLAEMADQWSGRVIHFSTDCVFSGKKGSYTEKDSSDAEDLYGKSKFLGEVACENALTLRTSIIGRELTNFKSLLEWFLSQEGETIRGFTKVMYSGVTTNYISRVVGEIIEKRPALSGLYQLTSNTISKHDLLCLLKDSFGVKVEIIPDDGEVSDRSMIGTKFNNATHIDCPSWPELTAELANDPTPYADWR